MNKFRTGRRIAAVTVLAAVLAAEGAGTTVVRADTTANDQTSSFDYKLYKTEEEYETELSKEMDRVYDTLKGHIQASYTFPIPGIISTSYLENDANQTSNYFIPQGICRAGDYILITGYHNAKINGEEKESNDGWSSVIYLIDAKTQEYVTTMKLPQNYHNGGIACDGENVWFCGDTKDKYLLENKPFVQCMKLSRLEEIASDVRKNRKSSGTIEEADFSEKIEIDNKPSFLECTDGMLWVGTYIEDNEQKNDGFIIGYPIQNSSDQTPALDKLNVRRINGISSSAQGMDIDGNTLFVSSSAIAGQNWVSSSFITTYDISELLNGGSLIDVSGSILKQVEVPKMNEEILVDDSTVSVVFEAASEKYRADYSSAMQTDRILVIDKSLWE